MLSYGIDRKQTMQNIHSLNRHIFLTGGTGLVGGNLLPRLLSADSRARITLLIRASSDVEAHARLKRLWQEWATQADFHKVQHRIQVVRGDVTLSRLGLSEALFRELAADVTEILHSAATVKFNLPLEEARAINCLGTQQIIELARQAARAKLRHLACISTSYVCGNRTGLIREDELDCGQSFANTYEQAKFESEKNLREFKKELPLTIFRPSIIIGDSKTGKTTAFNVLYHPLKLFHRGYLTLIPGDPSTKLDIVPVDYVADAISHILLHTEHAGKTYHLAAGSKQSCKAGDISDQAIAYFNRLNPGKYKPIQFISLEVYDALRTMAPPAIQEAMKKMDFYLPYLTHQHDFDDVNTRRALAGTSISAPSLLDYLEKTLEYCVATDWGEAPSTRHAK
jgi:long-chain acyl-CoA synthetase